MKTLTGVSKRWNKNIFQLLARDKVYKKIVLGLQKWASQKRQPNSKDDDGRLELLVLAVKIINEDR